MILVEGGNIFGDLTKSIKKENIEETVSEYFKQLAKVFPKKSEIFNKKHFHFVGSVGKKDVSGDIDFAVDVSSIVDADVSKESVEKWGVDHDKLIEMFKKLKSRAKTSSDSMLMMKALLTEISKIINDSTSDLHCDEKKVTTGNLFGLFPQYVDGVKQEYGVQMDWMVGDLEWLKFSYYSDVYKGAVKGLHRTQLMLSMFDYYGYRFDHVNGIKNKETGEQVSKNVAEALDVLSKLVNKKITPEISNDYFKLVDVVNGLPKKDREGILEIYFKILDRTRADIPENLQDDWKKMKTKLGLTGKFLPDSSNLKRESITQKIVKVLRG
jgi:hypothetical protein